MATNEQAQAAIDQLNGQMLDGRSLRVNEAQERTSRRGDDRQGSRGDRGGRW
jgi:RNA recognition motif-containing protein